MSLPIPYFPNGDAFDSSYYLYDPFSAAPWGFDLEETGGFDYAFESVAIIDPPVSLASSDQVSSSTSANDESSTSHSSARVTIQESFLLRAIERCLCDEDGRIHVAYSSAHHFATAVLQGQRKTSRAGRKKRNRKSKKRSAYAHMHDALHKSGWKRGTDGKEWLYWKDTAPQASSILF
jgi:hypothetical protein